MTSLQIRYFLRVAESMSFSQAAQELYFESNSFAMLRSRLCSGALDAILCTKTSLMEFDGLNILPVCNLKCRAYVRKGLLCPEDEALPQRMSTGLCP